MLSHNSQLISRRSIIFPIVRPIARPIATRPIVICKTDFDLGLHIFSKGIITFTMIYCGLNYLHYRNK